MSSQPNQSLIDGIRCLQYLVSSDKAIGCRELARQMGMNSTRVNRLLMTMASVGLTMQDEHRRYLPGPGIHALAAQAIRGSSLFAQALAGFRMLPAWQSVIGVALLAAEPDERLQPRFSEEQWMQIAPLLARKREAEHLIWHRDDGEISMALPINNNRAALAFAKIWQADAGQLAQRQEQLQTLARCIAPGRAG